MYSSNRPLTPPDKQLSYQGHVNFQGSVVTPSHQKVHWLYVLQEPHIHNVTFHVLSIKTTRCCTQLRCRAFFHCVCNLSNHFGKPFVIVVCRISFHSVFLKYGNKTQRVSVLLQYNMQYYILFSAVASFQQHLPSYSSLHIS